MKIIVIGSYGFIGSQCSDFLKRKNYEVWETDIIPKENHGYILLDKNNIDFEPIFKIQKFDVCINASGAAKVDFSFQQPALDFELNVINVSKLLSAIQKYNPTCRVINFSSAAVYGNPKNLPISEEDPTNPLSPYGFHKLQSELLLNSYYKCFGIHTCSLRIFSAYGIGLKKQLFWDLYQKKQNQPLIMLFGTGKESRDFIFIDDLLQAIYIIIQKANFEGECINISSGIETKIKDAVAIFYKNLDENILFHFSGTVKVGDPNNWQADIQKLKQMGFTPQISIEEGLKKYVTWLKESE